MKHKSAQTALFDYVMPSLWAWAEWLACNFERIGLVSLWLGQAMLTNVNARQLPNSQRIFLDILHGILFSHQEKYLLKSLTFQLQIWLKLTSPQYSILIAPRVRKRLTWQLFCK